MIDDIGIEMDDSPTEPTISPNQEVEHALTDLTIAISGDLLPTSSCGTVPIKNCNIVNNKSLNEMGQDAKTKFNPPKPKQQQKQMQNQLQNKQQRTSNTRQ